LRQRSRPYLFSNALSPVVAGVTCRAIDLIEESPQLIQKLQSNTAYFRNSLKESGLDVKSGVHPIVPFMIGDAKQAHEMADRLLQEGIYVVGFSFPVVPNGEARIRFQISAAHDVNDIDYLIEKVKSIHDGM